MMNIDNIKIVDYSIEFENSRFSKLIEANKHLLPNQKKSSITFDLINSNEAFANAIRRVFNDEILVKCLTANVYDIDTNDKYILPDTIIERINLLSLDQTIDDNNIFHLNVINNTNGIINVYAKDIVNKNKNDIKSYFNKNIQICSLKPNRHINISNIKINKDYGYNNSIYSLGSFRYEIINTDFNLSSLNNTVKDFRLELINNGNITIKDIITKIYDALYIRLKNIQSLINDYDIELNTDEIHSLNNELYIILNKSIKETNIMDNSITIPKDYNDIYEIYINNEYHTMANLLTKYVFQLDPNIELINYRLIHPLTHKVVITIKHSNYKKIINDAIENIIVDLNIFKSTILKNI